MLQMAFDVFDTAGTGRVTMEDLRSKLTTMGEHMTDAEVDDLIAHADKNGDGVITLAEFRAMECWGITSSAVG